MSDNLQPQGNFGILDTQDTGAGDAQLLNDLMAPETATADSEAVQPIVKETEDKAPEPSTPKGKEITAPASPDGKTDEEKVDGESLINDFLSSNPDDEAEEQPEAEAEVEETKDVLDEVVNDVPEG